MRTGLYMGSFNPWHVGHDDILNKALKVFDKVIVLMCQNPEKASNEFIGKLYIEQAPKIHQLRQNVEVELWTGTIIDYIKNKDITAMIRGLRNGMDLEYEIAQMGLHEDTGNHLPYVCFLTDRKYGHVSSSAVRALDKLGLEHGYTK